MKFALVDGKRTEAFAGGRGTCRGCDAEVIGKCGEFRIHHWAHKVRGDCAAGSKEETPWHRQWKDKYPPDWQEWHAIDPITGEKHFADVRTKKGLVLEFQNSPIKPSERRSREAFYGNMLWVVNEARLSYDYPRFINQLRRNDTRVDGRWHFFWWAKKAFPKTWNESSVLVFFDFLGDLPLESPDEDRRPLWCLFPGSVKGYGLVVKVLRNEFLRITTEREFPFKKPPMKVLADKESVIEKLQDEWLRRMTRRR